MSRAAAPMRASAPLVVAALLLAALTAAPAGAASASWTDPTGDVTYYDAWTGDASTTSLDEVDLTSMTADFTATDLVVTLTVREYSPYLLDNWFVDIDLDGQHEDYQFDYTVAADNPPDGSASMWRNHPEFEFRFCGATESLAGTTMTITIPRTCFDAGVDSVYLSASTYTKTDDPDCCYSSWPDDIPNGSFQTVGPLTAAQAPPPQPAPAPEPEPEPEPTATDEPTPDPEPTATDGPEPTGEPDPAPPVRVAFDGDGATTQRVEAANPTDGAVWVSQARFADAAAARGGDGRPAARWAVLSRDDVFADSLGGSALAGDGPLLFTSSATLSPASRAELHRTLPAGAEVFLLGGTSAIAVAVEHELADAGFVPVRLAGPSRVETALAVADEVRARYGDTGVALLARDDSWADSVAAGGYAQQAQSPILLSPTSGLPAAVQAWLEGDAPTSTVLLGGAAALSDAVEQAAPNPRRVAGPDRAGTAVQIGRSLVGMPTAGGRQVVVSPGWRADGWAWGLAASGLVADHSAPLLLVDTTALPAATRDAVSACGDPQVDVLVVGSPAVVTGGVVAALDDVDGPAC